MLTIPFHVFFFFLVYPIYWIRSVSLRVLSEKKKNNNNSRALDYSWKGWIIANDNDDTAMPQFPSEKNKESFL